MMRQSLPWLYSVALILIGAFILGSCSNNAIDPTLPVVDPEEPIPIPVGPSLSFVNEVNFVSGPNATVRPGSKFSTILKGMKGDSTLTDLEVLLNGQPLSTTDFKVDGAVPNSNFFVLTGDERDEFQWVFEIQALTDSTRVIYEFKLTAKDGRTDGAALTVDTDLTESSPPNIELLTTEKLKVILGDEAEFLIRVDALGSDIDSIAIFSGVNLVDPDRLSFGGTKFSTNPVPVEGADRRFFEKTIGIIPLLAIEQRYTMQLKDAKGETYSLELIFIGE